MMKKIFLNWLLYDYVINIVETELSFDIKFIEDGVLVHSGSMKIVPQIASKVEVKERFFLVQDVVYSPYGAVIKVIGKFV